MIYKIPLRLISAANVREHWTKRARRVKQERKAALLIHNHPLPCIVTIIRHGKRLMDGDNLQSAAKGLRDGIADRLGVDDADPRVTWKYAQEKATYYGVTVTITESYGDLLAQGTGEQKWKAG
jgi:hypothetical protein